MTKTDVTYNQKTTLKDILDALTPIAQMDWTDLAEILTKDYSEGIWHFCDLDRDQQVSVVLSCPSLYDALKAFWESITNDGIISIADFDSASIGFHLNFDYQILVQCSLNLSVIYKIDEYYIVNRENVLQAISHMDVPHNRNSRDDLREILTTFFSYWCTLKEAGAMFGLTRERVRQYAKKFAVTTEPLFEDYFAEPFQVFKFSRDDFVDIFPEIGITGFKYISLRYDSGDAPFTEENIDKYTGLWHNRISNFFEDRLNAKKNQPTAQELIINILKDNLNYPMTTRELYTKYVQLTEAHPISEISVYNLINKRTDIIINKNNRYRLYEMDPQPLWDTVDFDKYKDSVITTDLIYRDYPELMRELQILDSRELYYVIKNTVPDYWDNRFRIHCRRCPVLMMGDKTDGEQALQLLKEISPVSHSDFYAEYDKRFGSPQEIAQGNPGIRNALAPYNTGSYYIYNPTN